MEQNTLNSLRTRHRRQAIFIVAASVFLAAPWQCYLTTQRVDDFRIMDRSWQYDLPWEMAKGRLVGRDYVFNYGSLYQLLHGLPLFIWPGDRAALIRFHDLPEVTISILAAWFLLGLTGAPHRWRAGIFAAWTVVLAMPMEFHATHLKPVGGFALVTYCGWLLGQAISERAARRRWLSRVVWTVGPPLVALYSFEFGLMACMALLMLVAIAIAVSWRLDRSSATRLRCAAVRGGAMSAAGLGALLATFWAAPPLKYYLPNWLQIAIHYADAKSVSVAPWKLLCLAAALTALGLLLLWLATRLRACLATPSRAASWWAVFAAACFSILWLRYGLVRGGISHLYRGLMPAIFTLGCLAPCLLVATLPTATTEKELDDKDAPPATQPGTGWLAPPRVAIMLCAVALGPFALTHAFRAGMIVRLAHLARLDPRSAQLSIQDKPLAKAVATARGQISPAVYVWPYEVMINMLADKANPTYTFQSTSAHGERLQQAVAKHLEAHDQPPPTLIFRRSKPLDGVAHITRTGVIFRYLLEHYELASPPTAAFAMLRHTAARRPWKFEPLVMPGQRVFFKPGKNRAARVAINRVAASDLLLLKLRVAKTSRWGIGKPGHLVCRLLLSDGSVRDRLLLVPADGQSHEVLISGLTIADQLFFSHFVAGRQWRSTERVRQLILTWSPMDLLSRLPAEVQLEAAGRLVRLEADVLETSLSRQDNHAVEHWCFQQGPRPPTEK